MTANNTDESPRQPSVKQKSPAVGRTPWDVLSEVFRILGTAAPIVIVIGAPAGLALIKHKKGEGSLGIIRNFKRYVIHIGVLGCVIGFIQMGAANITDMTVYARGSGIAILTVFYGIIIYCILDAFTDQTKT